jgi:hypothetical protein
MLRSARIGICLVVVLLAGGVAAPPRSQGAEATGTPRELVNAYASLADTILAAKKTEWGLVQSILATTYGHAQAALAGARSRIQSGKDARADLEKLASLVSQLGNEGDAAVGAVRKKLVEGGHHHHAAGEQQGLYDEGFVIVTRAAKKVFLDAAGKIGRMAAAPDAAALDAEWQKVAKQYADLMTARAN